jgi:hypothetical protein
MRFGIPLAAILLGVTCPRAVACDPPSSEKMAKQIGVMEKIVNQVLVDSPNFFIQERENCRGMYVKDSGLVFTFSASLVEKDWDLDKLLSWSDVEVEKTDEGYTVRTKDKNKNKDKEDPEGDEEAEEVEIDEATLRKKQERTYLRGKTELIDVILDYGDTLTTLESGKYLTIVGYLRDSDYFDEEGFSRLILKAKIDDIRAYGTGKISEDEMIKRITQAKF